MGIISNSFVFLVALYLLVLLLVVYWFAIGWYLFNVLLGSLVY